MTTKWRKSVEERATPEQWDEALDRLNSTAGDMPEPWFSVTLAILIEYKEDLARSAMDRVRELEAYVKTWDEAHAVLIKEHDARVRELEAENAQLRDLAASEQALAMQYAEDLDRLRPVVDAAVAYVAAHDAALIAAIDKLNDAVCAYMEEGE